MNRSFKIVSRDPRTNRQLKKRVYTSHEDYVRYKDDLTDRYTRWSNVEHYELLETKWVLVLEVPYKK